MPPLERRSWRRFTPHHSALLGPYAYVEMRSRTGGSEHSFPVVETLYLSMEDVMGLYSGNRLAAKIALPAKPTRDRSEQSRTAQLPLA